MTCGRNSADGFRRYLQLGKPLFPVDRVTRAPLVRDGGGFYGASTDEATIAGWLQRWPHCLPATPTGKAFGLVVIDVDIKHPPVNGFDSLTELGWSILPDTALAHSPSGGLHIYVDPCGREVPTTQSTVAPGLDIRAELSSIVLPVPGSGYHWDPHWHLGNTPLAPAPDWAILPAREHQSADYQGPPAKLKDRYAAAALADACWKIRHAPAGVQEITLYSECKSIGTLAGADGIPTSIALGELLRAARDLPDFDHRRRWRSRELQRKVEHAFADGLRRPRGQRHG